jgi:hypothetical protein
MFAHIPPSYWQRAYIAGGWAACPALAQDMDVWILATNKQANDPDFKLEDLRARVLKAMPRVTRAEDSDETGDYGGVEIKIRKVCLIEDAFGVKVHVMVTDAPIIETVLANFDISTHQVAIDYRGLVIRGNCWTPITQPPIVVEERRNEHTEGRLKKITERYRRQA